VGSYEYGYKFQGLKNEISLFYPSLLLSMALEAFKLHFTSSTNFQVSAAIYQIMKPIRLEFSCFRYYTTIIECTVSKRIRCGGTPGSVYTLSGNRLGRAVLRKEQLECNRLENRRTGKEIEADHRRYGHSPQQCDTQTRY
jgi:hypothetical protein